MVIRNFRVRLFFVYLFKDFVATSFAASFFPKLWTLEKIGNGKRFELLLFAFVHQVLLALQLMVVHKTKTEKRGREITNYFTHKSLKNLAQKIPYGLFYLETHRYFMFMSDPVCSPTSFFFSWQKSHSGFLSLYSKSTILPKVVKVVKLTWVQSVKVVKLTWVQNVKNVKLTWVQNVEDVKLI